MTGNPEPAVQELQRQPFSEHLLELRRRLLWSLGIVVVGCLVAFVFREPLYAWLMEPYRQGMAAHFGPEMAEQMAFRSPIEPILVYMKTALLAGFLVTVPLVLHQVWLFVAPGLYDAERRLAWPFLFFTYLFFSGGVLFCRYLVLSPAMTVLLGFAAPDQASPSIMMQDYFAFTSKLLLLFGALFELPVVMAFLALIGVVTSAGLRKQWRIAVVGAFVVGAMLTPPDPLTQIALAIPMVCLYGLSIVVVWIIEGRRSQDREEAS